MYCWSQLESISWQPGERTSWGLDLENQGPKKISEIGVSDEAHDDDRSGDDDSDDSNDDDNDNVNDDSNEGDIQSSSKTD